MFSQAGLTPEAVEFAGRQGVLVSGGDELKALERMVA